MKKLLTLVLSFALILPLAACGNDRTNQTSNPTSETINTEDDQETENSTTEEVKIGIEVDKDLRTVEITIPADLVGDISEEELRKKIEKSGFDSYTLNADGSVTYKLSRVKHQAFLDDFKEDIDEMIANTIDNEDSSVTKITYNDDLTAFTITVDSAKYTVFDTMKAYSFFAMGSLYQSFSGVDLDKIDVNIRFIDENGTELAEESYKEWFDDLRDAIEDDHD